VAILITGQGMAAMPTSILIIDDSDNIRNSIVNALREVALFEQYREAKNGIDGLKSLLDNRADLIICDLEMPRMDGFKFLAMLNSREELKDIPVIMLTGKEDRQSKIKGLEQGAVDYVTKPFDTGELVARVKVQLKIKALQDELRKSNEMLLELSNTDHLTRLYNRRHLMETLEREFKRALREGGFFSLIMLDIDNFKKVNDTYGHQEGDTVLVAVANAIRRALRPYDYAARYGGEEFALLLPATNLIGSVQAAERVRKGIESMNFADQLQNLVVTASLGIATYPSSQVYCIDALITEADDALYRAKASGKNRIESMVVAT
jgi:two-component system, cell cycle response regulator